MKAMLMVIQNDADHAEAKALIAKLMGSDDPANVLIPRTAPAQRAQDTGCLIGEK